MQATDPGRPLRWAGMLALLTLWAAMGAAAAAETTMRTGYAYEADGGELLYTEEHRERVENGAVVSSEVTYRNASGKVIATKRLDFSGEPIHPDFRLQSTVTGHVEGAEQSGERCVVSFRDAGGEEVKTKEIVLPDQAIIDGGFDRFIEANWTGLLDGEVFKRPFLVPSRQAFVDFEIYLDEASGGDVTFVMEPASFLLRLVGGGIVVSYDRDDASLKLYEGISNIRDQSGDNYEVRIEFRSGGVGGNGGEAPPASES